MRSALSAAICVAYLHVCLFTHWASALRPDPAKTLIYGGGINPRIVTPARYFFIQSVDENGQNITKSLGPKAYQVSASTKSKGGKTRSLTTNLMDRGDGSYSVRYIMNEVPHVLTIQVTLSDAFGGGHVAGSPYIFTGNHQAEMCDCPRGDVDGFEDDWGCSASDPADQIGADLAPFKAKGGIARADIDRGVALLKKNDTCFIHYVIKDNTIYTKGYGKYQGFKAFLDDMLYSLARKVRLPDTEFLLNLGDWPQVTRTAANGEPTDPVPVFAWCSSANHWEMVLPTYKMTEACVFGKDIENIQEMDGAAFAHGGAWEGKTEKAFWRGRPVVPIRTEATQLSKQHPDLLDLSATKNQFNYFPDDAARKEHKEWEARYGRKSDRMEFADYFKWKYQLNIDGTVAAYRLGALLAGNSLVLIQDSDYYEHYYRALKPNEHFVPVNRSLADLVDKVEWLRAHDAEAKAMMLKARQFTRDHLRVEDIYCYHHLALRRYSQLLTYDVEVRSGMEEVKHERSQCTCPAYAADGNGLGSLMAYGAIGGILAAIGALISFVLKSASKPSKPSAKTSKLSAKKSKKIQ